MHVCKTETLRTAYRLAKANHGAPGVDEVTFEAIEASGVEAFLAQLREELQQETYRPLRSWKTQIKKANGGVRTLSIPAIRDRVVQGALKLILEPIFDADFQPGSFGYRPQRSAHQAIERVTAAAATCKTHVIDLDLRAYFDNVQHHLDLQQVAKRINDDQVLHLLKLILKASGKRGVPHGGTISPLLSNLYLNEVDKMLERAKERTTKGKWQYVEYCRYAGDLVVFGQWRSREAWLVEAIDRRLREEFEKLRVAINEEKSHREDLTQGQIFGFLGFTFCRIRSLTGRWRMIRTPQSAKRTASLRKLKKLFRAGRSQPTAEVVRAINPVSQGEVNYPAYGQSSRCFSYVRNWVECKFRRLLHRSRQRQGFGW